MNLPQTRVNRFSIARKELLALCLGADLLKQWKLYLTLPIRQTYICVDSMTVIKWCHCSTKELAQFVQNRVDKILAIMDGIYPEYVKTCDNPANVASRGITAKQQKDFEIWTSGLTFLRQPTETWIVGIKLLKPNVHNEAVKAEMKTSAVRLNHIQLDSPNHVMKVLAEPFSAMEAEKNLANLRHCFLALHKNYSPQNEEIAFSKNEARLRLLKMA